MLPAHDGVNGQFTNLSSSDLSSGNPALIEQFLSRVGADGLNREIRLIPATPGSTRRRLWRPSTDPFADVMEYLRGGERDGFNAYVTGNALQPDYVPTTTTAAKGIDVARRTFILVDVDPDRESKTLATVEQRDAARAQVADPIIEWYAANFQGFLPPIIGCSGSGWQVLIPADLPATDAADRLVARLLKSLGETFNRDKVAHVDQSVKDRSRVMRICGTLAQYSADGGKRAGWFESGPTPDELRTGRRLTEAALVGYLGEEIIRKPERPRPPTSAAGNDAEKRFWSYIKPILAEITAAPNGEKHAVLFKKTAHIAGTAAGQDLTHMRETLVAEIEAALAANSGTVASWPDAKQTIQDAWNMGIRNPEYLSDRPAPTRRTANVQAEAADNDDDGVNAVSSPTLSTVAYHGPLGNLALAIAETSEATSEALLFNLLVYYGSAMGNRVKIKLGGVSHAPNIFGLIIGTTSAGRKGTADSLALQAMREIAPGWQTESVDTGIASGERLVETCADPEDDFGPPPGGKRLCLRNAEFQRILAATKGESSTLRSRLLEAYDGGDLCNNTVTRGRVIATDPHISLVGQIQPGVAVRHLEQNPDDICSGLMNRMLCVFSHNTRLMPAFATPDRSREEEHIKPLAESLAAWLKRSGFIRPTTAAADYFDQRRRERSTGVAEITGRWEANVTRIALIFAAADASEVIEPHHFEAAISAVEYSIATLAWLIQKNLRDNHGCDVLDLISRAGPEGLMKTQITLELRNRLRTSESRETLNRTLAQLVKNGLVIVKEGVSGGKGGRPSVRYAAR